MPQSTTPPLGTSLHAAFRVITGRDMAWAVFNLCWLLPVLLLSTSSPQDDAGRMTAAAAFGASILAAALPVVVAGSMRRSWYTLLVFVPSFWLSNTMWFQVFFRVHAWQHDDGLAPASFYVVLLIASIVYAAVAPALFGLGRLYAHVTKTNRPGM